MLRIDPWDQDVDQSPLRVFGPPPTVSLTRKLFDAPDGAFVCDWSARVSHPGSQRVFANRGGKLLRTAPKVDAVDIDATFVLDKGGLVFARRAYGSCAAVPGIARLPY